ncbi:protein deubiquitination [Balamuthia mandrillaris]
MGAAPSARGTTEHDLLFPQKKLDALGLLQTTTKAKGLTNSAGDNNCFLNVVIQSLWHLTSFRCEFVTNEQHYHQDPTSCVFCALKFLFTQYEFSEEAMLPPTALRNALSSSFQDEELFKPGEMYDAAETLVSVLSYVHNVLMGVDKNVETLCEPPCCVHKVFAMNIFDRTECQCGATSEPITSSSFLYHVYTSELRSLYANNKALRSHFDLLLSTLNDSEIHKCPDAARGCTRKNRNQRFLHNDPQVFTVSLVWDSPTPPVEHIKTVLRAISSLQVDLNTIFYATCAATSPASPDTLFPPPIVLSSSTSASLPSHLVSNNPNVYHSKFILPHQKSLSSSSSIPSTSSPSSSGLGFFSRMKKATIPTDRRREGRLNPPHHRNLYIFRGMICYYGKHYSAYFFSYTLNEWLCFDDEKVKVVGHNWESVVESCLSAHWQPSILFYEKKSVVDEMVRRDLESGNAHFREHSNGLRGMKEKEKEKNGKTIKTMADVEEAEPTNGKCTESEKDKIVMNEEKRANDKQTHRCIQPSSWDDRSLEEALMVFEMEENGPNKHRNQASPSSSEEAKNDMHQLPLLQNKDLNIEFVFGVNELQGSVLLMRHFSGFGLRWRLCLEKKDRSDAYLSLSLQRCDRRNREERSSLLLPASSSSSSLLTTSERMNMMMLIGSGAACMAGDGHIEEDYEEDDANGEEEKVNAISDLLFSNITFECRAHGWSFSSTFHDMTLGRREVLKDEFFLCPARQRAYLQQGAKFVGIALTMHLR